VAEASASATRMLDDLQDSLAAHLGFPSAGAGLG